MKLIKLFIITITCVVTITSCKLFRKVTPEMKLTEVYVEGGDIKGDTTFQSGGAFSASHTAIGMIDSSDCLPKVFNGYAATDGHIYVFKDGKIPSNISNLADFKRYKELAEANWANDYAYRLALDAEFCVNANEFTVYVREKGDYIRQKARIKGNDVYRFINRYVIEDYRGFLTYHEKLHTNTGTGDFFAMTGLNPSEYSMTVNGAPSTGVINLTALGFTPLGTTDKIKFEKSPTDNVKYRLRHIYVNHSREILLKYFCFGDSNCDLKSIRNVYSEYARDGGMETKKNPWMVYLNTEVFPKYLEPNIRNYNCTICDKNILKSSRGGTNPNLDSPPLPSTSNGGY